MASASDFFLEQPTMISANLVVLFNYESYISYQQQFFKHTYSIEYVSSTKKFHRKFGEREACQPQQNFEGLRRRSPDF